MARLKLVKLWRPFTRDTREGFGPLPAPSWREGSKYSDGVVAAIGSGGVAGRQRSDRWKSGSAVRSRGVAGLDLIVAVLVAAGSGGVCGQPAAVGGVGGSGGELVFVDDPAEDVPASQWVKRSPKFVPRRSPTLAIGHAGAFALGGARWHSRNDRSSGRCVMTDDHELVGLDPFNILDQEAGRLDGFFSTRSAEEWLRPTRCDEWTVADVLRHLAATEVYHQACLDGNVAALVTQVGERGATDLDSANALGVADLADRPTGELLLQWRSTNAESRRRFRERGDGTVDTSVGEYPCRWQAFHVASELATHADDVGVPLTADEITDRRTWRARFSRFALAEAKPDLSIRTVDALTIVGDGSIELQLNADELIEGVADRLSESSEIDAPGRRMLSTMP